MPRGPEIINYLRSHKKTLPLQALFRHFKKCLNKGFLELATAKNFSEKKDI
jgi:hypothetical protein